MKKAVVILVVTSLLSVATAAIWRLLHSDSVVILNDDGPARWIRADQRFDVAAKDNVATIATFTTPIQITPTQIHATLEVMALRHVEMEIDGAPIFDYGPISPNWKSVHRVAIPPMVATGKHLLSCRVSNVNGPSLIRVKCPALGLNSDASWLADADGGPFKAAVLADAVWEPKVDQHYLPTRHGMIALVPLLAVFFAAGALIGSRRRKPGPMVWPVRFRWILLGAWLLLGMNNIFKVPRFSGYDLDGHYQYISFVATHLSLPRPDLGWQTFQSPLYYIASAILSRCLAAMGATDSSLPFLLRMIPLACGAAMVEIGFRAGRRVFPDRADLQLITTTLSALTPVNLYMAQTVSNEPMAAVAGGAVLLIILRLLKNPQTARSNQWLAIAGLTLGVAFLTKINALLWALPLAVAMAIALRQTRANSICWIKAAGWVIAMVLLCSGGLIVRNIRLIGKPFYLQSSVAGHRWWQDPGYRVPGNFYEFGHVFSRPIQNGTASIWDSIYATLWATGFPNGPIPWNLGLMWHGLWLALIPTALIFAGVFRLIVRRDHDPARACLWISLLAVVCFTAAILYVFITLPVFSCGKASYMLGTMPCLGLLAAYGFDGLTAQKRWRSITCGGLFCWAMTAYLTYFVF